MKKYTLFIAIVLFFNIAFSQTQKQILNEFQLPIIDVSAEAYRSLKQEGKLLNHLEYKIEGASNTLNRIPVNSSPNVLSPCNSISYNGSQASFGGALDDALATVSFPFIFCFYGTTYTNCNVSVNGNVQFTTTSSAFSSTGFPSNAVNMIAPFWSDVYLTTGSSIKIDLYPTRMVISWDSVGYYNNHNDKTNSFQLVLTDGTDPILPVGKNVGFYYKKMQWTTGDASSGTGGFPNFGTSSPATIGINRGNGIHYSIIGKFGAAGNNYDGPAGNDDGVYWLDGKRFYFNACDTSNSNLEPISSNSNSCDTLKICGNDSIRITDSFYGPETTQTVNISISAPSLSGALNYSTSQANGITSLNLSIGGASATNGYHTITINASDNGTPALSSTYYKTIFIDHSETNNSNVTISTTPTIGICPGQTFTATANFSGTTPTSYSWNNGSTYSFSYYTLNTTSDSLVTLTINTNGCQKTIYGSVHVNPVPTAAIIGNTSFCGGQGSTTVLTASNTTNYSAQAPYTYTWTSTTFSNSINSQTIAATQGSYSVSIMNAYNCVNNSYTTVTVNPQPNFTVTPSYTSTSMGSTVNLDINLGGGGSVSCGLASSNCVSSNTYIVGTGSVNNTNSTYPAPYGNYYDSQHYQSLYTASELLAAGVVPGYINSLAFNVSNLNGAINAFKDYTIKIKCTSAANTSAWDMSGFTQVFYAPSYTVATGWNIHNFASAYQWDGVSNLLIDICSNDNGFSFTGNAATPYTTTTFTSSIWYRADGINTCGLTTTSGTSSNRPNVRFSNCTSIPNPNEFAYSWSPTTGLSDPTIKNPTLTVSGSQVYTVTVTYTNSPSCPTVGTATIDILPTSLTSNNLERNITIYPNPNNGSFEVNITGNELLNEQLKLEIINTLGQTVFSTSLSEQKTKLNLQQLNNGVYFINISNNEKQKAITRIVVQH